LLKFKLKRCYKDKLKSWIKGSLDNLIVKDKKKKKAAPNAQLLKILWVLNF